MNVRYYLVPIILHCRDWDVVVAQGRRVREDGRSTNVLEAGGEEDLVLSADDDVEIVWQAERSLDVAKERHPELESGLVVDLLNVKTS